MKKTIAGLIGILFIMLIATTNVYAANESINLQINKNEFEKGEEIVLDVEITNAKTTQGVAAMMATIEYDKESLTFEKVKGENGWATPAYNKEIGHLIVDKNSNLNGNEIVMKFTFKVRDGAKQNQSITLKDIVFSGGEEDIEIANATKKFTIKNGVSNSEEDNANEGIAGNKNLGNENENNNISSETNATNELAENNLIEDKVEQTDNTNLKENENAEKKGNMGLIIVGIVLAILILAIFIRIQVVKQRRKRRKKKSSH